jgi:hypothetical protein
MILNDLSIIFSLLEIFGHEQQSIAHEIVKLQVDFITKIMKDLLKENLVDLSLKNEKRIDQKQYYYEIQKIEVENILLAKLNLELFHTIHQRILFYDELQITTHDNQLFGLFELFTLNSIILKNEVLVV